MRRDLSIIVQLGLAFALLFSAFNSQGLIEISVLRKLAEKAPETGITESSGYYSLSIIYFVFTLSNLIVPPLVNFLGSKWSQVCGSLCYLVFMLTFLRLNAFLLYASSALLGFGAALLWTGQGCYLVEFSRNGKMTRNAGIMWAMLQSSLIVGGVFLIFMLKNGDLTSSFNSIYTAFTVVSGLGIFLLATLPSYPPQYEFEDVPSDERNLINEEESRPRQSQDAVETVSRLDQFKNTFSLLATPDMMVLSITFLYTGFEMTFYTGVYTACLSATTALKTYSDLVIPYNALVIGAGQIIGGIVGGPLGQTLGMTRAHKVFGGLIGNSIAFFLCFLILPFDSPIHQSTDMQTYIEPTLLLTLCISFLLGLSDAFWQTQIYVMVGELFRFDSTSAFAIYKFFQSMSACISFYYGASLMLHWQLLILIISCFCSAFAFLRIDYKCMIAATHHTAEDEE